MKNLKIIKNNFFLIILLLFSEIIYSEENKIIFKIDNLAFTSLDYDKRLEYLEFVGANNSISKKNIIDDFISANLFYEYYKKGSNKNDYLKEINEIYENIINNNDLSATEFDKENILYNIKIDYIRKIILQEILNANLSSFNTSLKEIDLLYKFNLTYINLDKKDFIEINKNFISLNKYNSEDIEKYLIKNNITYFIKETEINNIEEIDKRIMNSIISNENFVIFEKNDGYSLIFINKNFETLNGILVNLYSIKSNQEIDEKYLNCKYLKENNNNETIIQKEYEFNKLNNELKNNLINIDDYVKFKNNNEIVYVVLCNIKFNREILNSINLNKLINSSVSDLEKNFINKYSKIYNLLIINE